MKKMFYGLDMSTYTVNLSPSSNINTDLKSNSSANSLLSAYMLDYNLSYSHLSLGSNYLYSQDIADLAKFNITNNDNTIYQDSYNNYIFSLSSTSLIANFNNFKHNKVDTNNFSSYLK